MLNGALGDVREDRVAVLADVVDDLAMPAESDLASYLGQKPPAQLPPITGPPYTGML